MKVWQGVGHPVTAKEISGQWNGENQLKMDNALKYIQIYECVLCVRCMRGCVCVLYALHATLLCVHVQGRHSLIEGNNNLDRLGAFYNVHIMYYHNNNSDNDF